MKKISLRPNGSKRVIRVIEGESQADPSFRDDCDINVIVRRYLKTGLLPQNSTKGIYADTTLFPDLAHAMNVVAHANETFENLPSSIRKRFSNDPRELIEFLEDSKNDDEAIRLGLKVKKTGLNPQDSNGDKRQRVQSSDDKKAPKKSKAPANDESNDDSQGPD